MCHHRFRHLTWVVLFSLCSIQLSHAESADSPPSPPAEVTDTLPTKLDLHFDGEVSVLRRSAATFTAIVPGILVPGSGSFTLGDSRTGKKLLSMAGIGAAIFLAGVIPAVLTYGADEVIGPALPLVIGGGGLFVTSWGADLASALGVYRWLGDRSAPPEVALRLGSMHVYDPLFPYRWFATVSGEYRPGNTRISALGEFAVDADNQRIELNVGQTVFRDVWGLGEHSYFEPSLEMTMHNDGDSGFATLSAAAFWAFHLEMGNISRRLHGLYSDVKVGFGFEMTNYANVNGFHDSNGLPLGRFGLGAHLPRGGTWSIYYDHRRDTFTGGLVFAGQGFFARPSSFVGHIGTAARFPLAGPVWLNLGFEVGSAYVSRVSLEIPWGQAR